MQLLQQKSPKLLLMKIILLPWCEVSPLCVIASKSILFAIIGATRVYFLTLQRRAKRLNTGKLEESQAVQTNPAKAQCM